MRRVYVTVIVCTILLLGVLVLALVAKPEVQSGESQQLLWITLASAVAIAYGGMGLTLVIVSSAHRNFRERRLLGLSESLQENERELAESGDELDLPSLWAATQKRIDYYHEIATSQAEISFRTGMIASVAGFILLLVVAVLGMFATSAPAAITVGSVGVAGAAMSAYIGATFLKAQSEASAQLRQFFLGVGRIRGRWPVRIRHQRLQHRLHRRMEQRGRHRHSRLGLLAAVHSITGMLDQ